MSKSERQVSGDFIVNHDECQFVKICFRYAGKHLGVEKINNQNRTIVREQPKNEEEKLNMMIALISCPFGAIEYKGSSSHPETTSYVTRLVEDPTILQKFDRSNRRLQKRK